MGTGWRRAFCTTIHRDADSSSPLEPQSSPSSKIGANLGFFRRSRSSRSTPRPQHQTQSPPSTPALRCRTQLPTGFTDTDATERATLQSQSSSTALLAEPATPGSYRQSVRLPFVSSNPSSPRSPSRLALLLRNNLRFTRVSNSFDGNLVPLPFIPPSIETRGVVLSPSPSIPFPRILCLSSFP